MSPVSGLHRVPGACGMGEEEARVMLVWVLWVQPHQACVLKACAYSFLPPPVLLWAWRRGKRRSACGLHQSWMIEVAESVG